jgi:hypothetical protein
MDLLARVALEMACAVAKKLKETKLAKAGEILQEGAPRRRSAFTRSRGSTGGS